MPYTIALPSIIVPAPRIVRIHVPRASLAGCGTHIGLDWRQIRRHDIYWEPLPHTSSIPSSTITRNLLMSTSSQGASGPSAHPGFRPPPVQPVSGNHATPGPALTRLNVNSHPKNG